jgi:hypothetical protein
MPRSTAPSSFPNLLSNWHPKWKPREILRIINNDHCMSEQCTVRLSHENSAQVGHLLDILADKQPVADSFLLGLLARRGLCPAHHDKADIKVKTWRRRIMNSYPALFVPQVDAIFTMRPEGRSGLETMDNEMYAPPGASSLPTVTAPTLPLYQHTVRWTSLNSILIRRGMRDLLQRRATFCMPCIGTGELCS